jgi:hypothetical protein
MRTLRSATLPVLLGLLLASGMFSFGATRARADGYYFPSHSLQVYVTHCHVRGTDAMWQSQSMASVNCP